MKTKVLLVEDHLGERIKMMKVLQEFGFDVETAVTFGRARELVSRRQYDLVISELLLSHCPELQGDGIQFAKVLESIHPETPIYLVAEEGLMKTTALLMEGAHCPPIYERHSSCGAIKSEILKSVKKAAA
jgi:DNA-binding NtrC family response regulator